MEASLNKLNRGKFNIVLNAYTFIYVFIIYIYLFDNLNLDHFTAVQSLLLTSGSHEREMLCLIIIYGHLSLRFTSNVSNKLFL